MINRIILKIIIIIVIINVYNKRFLYILICLVYFIKNIIFSLYLKIPYVYGNGKQDCDFMSKKHVCGLHLTKYKIY